MNTKHAKKQILYEVLTNLTIFCKFIESFIVFLKTPIIEKIIPFLFDSGLLETVRAKYRPQTSFFSFDFFYL